MNSKQAFACDEDAVRYLVDTENKMSYLQFKYIVMMFVGRIGKQKCLQAMQTSKFSEVPANKRRDVCMALLHAAWSREKAPGVSFVMDEQTPYKKGGNYTAKGDAITAGNCVPVDTAVIKADSLSVITADKINTAVAPDSPDFDAWFTVPKPPVVLSPLLRETEPPSVFGQSMWRPWL